MGYQLRMFMKRVFKVILKIILVICFVVIVLLIILAAPRLSYNLSTIIEDRLHPRTAEMPKILTNNVVTTDNVVILPNNSILLIETDAGEQKEMSVGDILRIESILGNSIDSNELEAKAVQFKHFASNGCLKDQVIKFNGVNWLCEFVSNSGVIAQNVNSIEVTGEGVKVIRLIGNNNENITTSFTDLNNYVTAIDFNSETGEISLERNDLTTLVLDINGRFLTNTGVASLTNKTININQNTIIGTSNRLVGFDSTGRLISTTIRLAEANQLSGVTANIQVQLNEKVGSTRRIITTGPLLGGGNLSADLILAISQASVATDGYLSSSDWQDFNNKLDTELDPRLPSAGTSGNILQSNGSSWSSVPASILLSIDWSEISNVNGIYMNYRPNNEECSDNEVLKYTSGLGWVCAEDVDTDTNNYVNSLVFYPATGFLSMGIQGMTALTTGMDGRYALDTHTHTLDSLSDVLITSVANNSFMVWDAVGAKWVNKTASELGLAPNIIYSTGLAYDSGTNTLTATINTGKNFGQRIYGGINPGEDLVIYSNTQGVGNAGDIYLNPNGGKVSVGHSNPQYTLDINGMIYTNGNNALTTEPRGFRAGQYYPILFENAVNNAADSVILQNAVASRNGDDVVYSYVGPNDTNNFGARGIIFSYSYNNGGADHGGIFFFTHNSPIVAGEVFSPSPNVVFSNNGRVGIGTLLPTQKLDVVGSITASGQLISTIASGTAPMAVTSNTLVSNFNADRLDGQDASAFSLSTHSHATLNRGAGLSGSSYDGSSGVTFALDMNSANTWVASQTISGLASLNIASSSGIQIQPYGTSSGNTADVRFYELLANGSEYTGFKAPNSIPTTNIYTMPASWPTGAAFMKSNSAGVLSWDTTVYGTGSVTSVTGANGLSGSVSTTGNIVLGGTLNSNTAIDLSGYSIGYNLDGTGDFEIRDAGTSFMHADDSGLIAIGSGFITPARLLDVRADGTNNNFLRLSYNSSTYTDFNTNSSGELLINPSGSNKRVIIGDGATGKLDVGTVDPLYTIEGNTYATYVASMIGQKEEMTGVLRLEDFDNTQNAYFAVLEFDQSNKELYVFKNICDFGANWSNLAVLVSADNSANVWYKKVKTENKIIVYSNVVAEVSFRLTANRFDHEQWPMDKGTNYDSKGFIIK